MSEVETVVENKAPDQADIYLGMSDEELMNAPPPAMKVVQTPLVESKKSEETPELKDDSEEKDNADDKKDDDEVDDKPSDDSEAKDDEPDGAAKSGEEVQAEAGKAGDKEKAPETKAEKDAKPDETPSVTINYEAEYKKLLTPFKANGREIQVQNVDDAIQLMQMGANYNKKMAALKPNLKLMKLLENNGLLNEEKLSFFIDLEKKNPEAINKLVKDSGIDPVDLDASKATSYKQTAYSVDDREIELDSVLDEIQGTPSYSKTLDIVSSKWDSASKQVIAKTPQLLKVINDHVDRGIYDIISKEVESERLFGRLDGLSDLEAYRKVGDAIQARGGFNNLSRTQVKPETKVPVVVTPKPKPAEDDKLKDKRRAASSTKPAGAVSTKADFNPLAISDEEFEKQINKKFL